MVDIPRILVHSSREDLFVSLFLLVNFGSLLFEAVSCWVVTFCNSKTSRFLGFSVEPTARVYRLIPK